MIAITREVSPSIDRAEVTHIERVPIDFARAAAQHEAYRDVLASLGCTVVTLPADPAYPDCVFVEDTAVVLEELAVITRPGAESRRGETATIAAELAKYRRLVSIEAPSTLDGGDVLVLDDRMYVGLSTRTNEAALAQLRALTGREVIGVPVHGALHLKTAVTRVAGDTLLLRPDWVDAAHFEGWRVIEAEEPNALLIGEVVVYPSAFPQTRAAMELRGIEVHSVDADELAKVEGGVTCCSLVFEAP